MKSAEDEFRMAQVQQWLRERKQDFVECPPKAAKLTPAGCASRWKSAAHSAGLKVPAPPLRIGAGLAAQGDKTQHADGVPWECVGCKLGAMRAEELALISPRQMLDGMKLRPKESFGVKGRHLLFPQCYDADPASVASKTKHIEFEDDDGE